MCGIVGIVNRRQPDPIPRDTLLGMLSAINHRGPDGFGIYRDDWASLGNARLSIIDIAGGDQPIGNEDGTLWIVFNGEIFNYIELRPGLEQRGHVFRTNCDTEVILHLYEEYGPECLKLLNGQFAIAIWDAPNRSLFLARDRVGIRPVFYHIFGDRFVFASEIKAMLEIPGFDLVIDPLALRETFTYWSPLPPHSVFRGVVELPPAHWMLVKDGQVQAPSRFWSLDFTFEHPERPAGAYLDELESLLIDATRIRLRADVPVGAYLSGGLDSSLTTALIRRYHPGRLDTFSIAFSDPAFDESAFQMQMASSLGTDHHRVLCNYEDIGSAFPEVIWHTETPILRTSPAPMFLLSQLVQQQGFKVVMTGEGADEFLAGYDIFKEMKLRRFWAVDPESSLRPRLLSRLYPDIRGLNASGAFLAAFFKKDLTETGSPFYSHLIRWKNTARTWRFLSPDLLAAQPADPSEVNPTIELPAGFTGWSALGQAQYNEIVTFLSPYLLSSQGDRVALAHSVEGRYPFLDYRVIEFCNRLPPNLKMPVLIEKWLLKQLGRKYLPEIIWQRNKRPYRAPIHRSFFQPKPPQYVEDLLSENTIRQSGYFNPDAVSRLAQKVRNGAGLSEVDDMALVGILSTQLVHEMYVCGRRLPGKTHTTHNCLVFDRTSGGNATARQPVQGG